MEKKVKKSVLNFRIVNNKVVPSVISDQIESIYINKKTEFHFKNVYKNNFRRNNCGSPFFVDQINNDIFNKQIKQIFKEKRTLFLLTCYQVVKNLIQNISLAQLFHK